MDMDRLTERNLTLLADFLSQEMRQPALATRIPDGAYIFYGSREDAELTQANLRLVSRVSLGIALGYIDEAPLVMIFEYAPGRKTVIDLSEDARRDAQAFVQSFQERSRREMVVRINALAPA